MWSVYLWSVYHNYLLPARAAAMRPSSHMHPCVRACVYAHHSTCTHSWCVMGCVCREHSMPFLLDQRNCTSMVGWSCLCCVSSEL